VEGRDVELANGVVEYGEVIEVQGGEPRRKRENTYIAADAMIVRN
jgi:hypothetical protein